MPEPLPPPRRARELHPNHGVDADERPTQSFELGLLADGLDGRPGPGEAGDFDDAAGLADQAGFPGLTGDPIRTTRPTTTWATATTEPRATTGTRNRTTTG
ncbi:hypothetical protein BJF85_25650 [Saccharomonospora sp. CUA-673]|uniref:hypothetical protein n=1 Tax=Saccharomonospora sp. CUA-673 TaxID=1904969 RepID=UPI00096267C2|nr:hypothetical protein [Saccharomonospora sp. CUA-673]OLT39541.1 hypothetical protein BJF85_25650 [Saccharomonospora sp. CUA-673]